eukprot:1339830-Rhodomonas_salina.3
MAESGESPQPSARWRAFFCAVSCWATRALCGDRYLRTAVPLLGVEISCVIMIDQGLQNEAAVAAMVSQDMAPISLRARCVMSSIHLGCSPHLPTSPLCDVRYSPRLHDLGPDTGVKWRWWVQGGFRSVSGKTMPVIVLPPLPRRRQARITAQVTRRDQMRNSAGAVQFVPGRRASEFNLRRGGGDHASILH